MNVYIVMKRSVGYYGDDIDRIFLQRRDAVIYVEAKRKTAKYCEYEIITKKATK